MKLFRMRAYSKDLRLKVLAAADRGMPRKERARVFGVSSRPRSNAGSSSGEGRAQEWIPNPYPVPRPGKGGCSKGGYRPPAKERPRSEPQGALRGVRGWVGGEGLGGHDDEPPDLSFAGRRLAARKKSPVAQEERDEGVRGLGRWLAKHFDGRRLWCSSMRAGCTPP